MIDQSKRIYTHHCHSFSNTLVSEFDDPLRQHAGYAKTNCPSLLQPPGSQGPRLRKRRSTEAGIGKGDDTNQSTERHARRLKPSQEDIEVDSSPSSNSNNTALLQEYKGLRNRYEDDARQKGKRIQHPRVKCCYCEDVVSDKQKCYCKHDLCGICFCFEGQVEWSEEGETPLGDIAEGLHDDVWELVRAGSRLSQSRDSLKAGQLNSEYFSLILLSSIVSV